MAFEKRPAVEKIDMVKVETETSMGSDEAIHGFEMEALFPRGGIPEPPQYVLAKLKGLDRAWRWLSQPAVRRLGLRGYTAYSPDEKDRKEIDRGNCAGGIAVSVDNRITWNEDAFLAWIPGRLHRERRRVVKERTHEQTKTSRDSGRFTDQAARGGLKAKFTVDNDDGNDAG